MTRRCDRLTQGSDKPTYKPRRDKTFASFFWSAGSLYLHTLVSFKPPMGWPQLVIHMFCVGLPFTLVVRRYANGKS